MTRRNDIHRSKRQGRTAGFTLVELMVALVAGAMAITSIYFVSSSSSHHFHEQQRIAQNQMTLRTAMAQLRRDFGRAGYLATPNTAQESACGVTPSTFAFGALLVENSATTCSGMACGTAVLDEATTNGVQADRVELTGNYVTGDAYKASGTQSSAQLMFSKTWQAFRRSFGADDLSEYSPALFDSAFAVKRYVLISHDARGFKFFAEITAVDGSTNPPTITIDRNLPECFGRCEGFGCTVSPISRIEYAVLDMGVAGSLSALDSSSPLAGTSGPVLVRRELEFDGTPTVVTNSERVVAEYVANFDVDVISNTNLGTGAPTLALQNDANAATLTGANPHRVRSAVISLSVRTPAEDSRFPFVAGAPALTRYELDPSVPGAARVRTSTIEVLLSNVASRDIRP
jgi:prepilin-type N-terminal cleavage/methylation domain-containing protein